MFFKAVFKAFLAVALLFTVLSLPPGPLYAQDDPNAQYITLLLGELSSETREIDVPVEVGVLRLQFSAQLVGALDLTIINPLGSPLSLSEPNISVTRTSDRRVITMWDPRPGKWKMRISGSGKFSASVTAQGDLYICCVQFFVRNGIYTLDRYQPVRGASLQTQVYASGFNVETIQFRMIDEQGKTIAPIKFRQADYSSPSGFSLLLEIPDQPFRLLASGRDVSGKEFQRVFQPIIRPLPANSAIAQNENSPGITINSQSMQELARTAVSDERPVIRAQALNWSDEQLLSEKGSPIGIRLKYSMKFPVDGSYSPMPQLYPERIGYGYTGALSMRMHRATVTPLPEGLQNSNPLILGMRAIFKAGVVYNFTVDMTPNYAIYNDQKKSFCTQTRPYNQQGIRERFEREIMSDLKLRFRFSISGSDFEGRQPSLTENVYAPKNWHLGFKRDGAAECN